MKTKDMNGLFITERKTVYPIGQEYADRAAELIAETRGLLCNMTTRHFEIPDASTGDIVDEAVSVVDDRAAKELLGGA